MTPAQMAGQRRAMKAAVADLIHAWAELESSLAFLFAIILAKPDAGQACFEVFYAPSNMETKIRMVDAAVIGRTRTLLFKEVVLDEWRTILNAINRSKGLRNKVAHGHMAEIGSAGLFPMRLRIIPPTFNYAPLFKAIEDGTPGGPTTADIRNSVGATYANAQRVMTLMHAWKFVDAEDEQGLREALAPLTAGRLKAAPQQDARTPPKQKAQRKPSQR